MYYTFDDSFQIIWLHHFWNNFLKKIKILNSFITVPYWTGRISFLFGKLCILRLFMNIWRPNFFILQSFIRSHFLDKLKKNPTLEKILPVERVVFFLFFDHAVFLIFFCITHSLMCRTFFWLVEEKSKCKNCKKWNPDVPRLMIFRHRNIKGIIFQCWDINLDILIFVVLFNFFQYKNNSLLISCIWISTDYLLVWIRYIRLKDRFFYSLLLNKILKMMCDFKYCTKWSHPTFFSQFQRKNHHKNGGNKLFQTNAFITNK